MPQSEGSQCTAEGITATKAIRLERLQREGKAPEAYTNHTECEMLATLVENFRLNFLKSSPHLRERLFLLKHNEFGIEEFVCSFIQPTLLPYTELYELRSCAAFLARYVVYEPLEESVIWNDGIKKEDGLAKSGTIVSPAQTLAWAVGDCFDLSFLLSSLLIGAGYDAFVVFGVAPQWIRLKDQSHMQCTLLQRGNDDTSNPRVAEVSITDQRYNEKPSDSDGIHCWILVKQGRRNDLDGPCFVETSTGILYPISSSPYSQAFSIWNDRNCWLNVGDGSIHGVEEFDFANRNKWVPVLPGAYSMPLWSDASQALELSREQFLLRYPPNGKRTISLDRAKVELYGENIEPQGVVSRIIQYEDTDKIMVTECTEICCPTRRIDHMTQRTRRPLENMHQEYFSYENEMCERTEATELRCVKWRAKTRSDGLVERVEEFEKTCASDGQEKGFCIIEHFLNRADGLRRRVVHISFLPKNAETKPKSYELFPGTGMAMAVISRIDESFEAPVDKSELEAVASRSCQLKEGSVRVMYHCEHEVLRREDFYNKDDMTRDQDDSHIKELIEWRNTSISEIKRIQTEMIRINTADPHAADKKEIRRLSSLPGPGKKDNGSDIGEVLDYLSPYLLAVDCQGQLSKEEALLVRDACLKDSKDRSSERASIIQSKIDMQRLLPSNGEADAKFGIGLLEKRLREHEEKSNRKYQELQTKLNDDVRLSSLRDDRH